MRRSTSFDPKDLKTAVTAGRIEWRMHAATRMNERGILRAHVVEALTKGECIEEYPDDKPFPSGLFFCQVAGQPLHVVASFDREAGRVHVVTAYVPIADKFEADWKTRKPSK